MPLFKLLHLLLLHLIRCSTYVDIHHIGSISFDNVDHHQFNFLAAIQFPKLHNFAFNDWGNLCLNSVPCSICSTWYPLPNLTSLNGLHTTVIFSKVNLSEGKVNNGESVRLTSNRSPLVWPHINMQALFACMGICNGSVAKVMINSKMPHRVYEDLVKARNCDKWSFQATKKIEQGCAIFVFPFSQIIGVKIFLPLVIKYT